MNRSPDTLTLDVNAALAALLSGGTILYPTDTIWGIGCDAANASAVAAIYKLKQRAATKSLIVLVADSDMLTRYVGLDAFLAARRFACADRPTTVIYPAAIGLAPGVAAADGSVGIRIARHPFCAALSLALGGAIVSTSANISGFAPSLTGLAAVAEAIRLGVTHVVNERQDTANGSAASRIVRLRPNGSAEILRP